jgi:dipeptidase D
MENFVETSTNLASVKFLENEIQLTTSQRSSVESEKHDATNMVTSVFRLAGARTKTSDGYPGWKPNPGSPIVDLSAKSYKKLFNQEPEVLAIHAGLECGLIGDKYPDMDMISFGPTIKGAHSPDERLHIESTVKFWNLLIEILKNIPKG